MSVVRVVASPLGSLRLEVEDGALVAVSFVDSGDLPEGHERHADATDRGVLDDTTSWLHDYFAGAHRPATMPLRPRGTPFQQQVWGALREIPRGTTCTYQQLAMRVSSVARAVGQANGANPIGVIVPCHRVIGGHSLVGYAGGLERKAWLLRHEGVSLPSSFSQGSLF
jgi:methylated-DNA-[protein]-cysteine S-methyltransferase